jgi:hypothetical protein
MLSMLDLNILKFNVYTSVQLMQKSLDPVS